MRSDVREDGKDCDTTQKVNVDGLRCGAVILNNGWHIEVD